MGRVKVDKFIDCETSESEPAENDDKPYEFTSIAGFRNIGNTCFMNSAIQTLIRCDLLTKFMLSHEFTGPLSNTYKNLLFNYTREKILSPGEVKHVLGKRFRRFMGFNQQDAHEFFIDFLDILEEEFKIDEKLTEDERKTVSILFDCKINTIIKSCETKQKSSIIEPVRSLAVAISDTQRISLESCLLNFIKSETLDDPANLWEAPDGNKEVATKTSIIKEFPPYLAFQVKRFTFTKGFGGKKLSTSINVKHKWTSLLFPEGKYYELSGFIFQSGSFYGGHYVSYGKIDGQWYCFNDSSVNKIDDKSVNLIAQKAYMLFYVMRSDTDNVYINTDLDNSDNEDEECAPVQGTRVMTTYEQPVSHMTKRERKKAKKNKKKGKHR